MSDSVNKIHEELRQFKDFKKSLTNIEIDPFGFILNPKSNAGKPQIDLLVTGLTHGNEVIGIQIINKMLAAIKHNNLKSRIGFLLNNTQAYLKQCRFLEYDLNRSFLSEKKNTIEHKRATEIENIIKNLDIKIMIDLHQCVEPTEKSFSVIPEDPELIKLSHKIAPQCEIATFSDKKGFSNKGRTLVDYAKTLNTPALVFELGQKGFNDQLSDEFSTLLLGLNVEKTLSFEHSGDITYYHMSDIVPNTRDFRLIPGLVSFQKLKAGEILAKNPDNQEFKSPKNSVLIFPRYINIDPVDAELAYLAEQRFLLC